MNTTIWTDKPLLIDTAEINHQQEGRLWEKAVYPIGNGRLGATAFGEPRRERIQFNQDSLWVGNEDNTGAYQPFGDVYVELPHDAYTDYRRELDIDRAVQTISYKSGGTTYTRSYFASYPDQVLVLHYTADTPGALSGIVSMGNIHEIPIVIEGDALVMKGDTSKFWYWNELVLKEPNRLIADREYASDKNIDLDFEARVKVLHSGGILEAKGDKLHFNGCDSITLILSAETNYVADRSKGWRDGDPGERVMAHIAAASAQSYDELLADHITDYQSIFHRVSLDIGTSPGVMSTLSTAERLALYREQLDAGKIPEDRELETLLYNYARYLMIGSSRPGHGALPTNLQGIWVFSKRPAWRCDFHTDVNIQMNYWFTSVANLLDCFEPFAQWIDSIREVRKEETRRVLGIDRGWLMRSENGIFGGSTWHIQKGDSAWLCQNLWDNYTFTQDKSYLKRYAYPVMKEISEFWTDHLKEIPDPAGKTDQTVLVVPEGRSPEHGPVGVDGVTYDQQLCFDLFSNTITASLALGVDPEFRAELEDKRDRLLKPRIGRWGQFQEWLDDIDDPKDDHRHINHLIGVYPGYHINHKTDPDLADAAKTSLLARRKCGSGHPGWSKVWKSCMFARLLDGELAFNELAEITASKIYDNLWAVHPPFQIDCNFGYAAAINEMLLQSHMGMVQLLPALPDSWPDGQVTGLRARGGFELDMEWKNGTLVKADIRGISNSSPKMAVSYGSAVISLNIECGSGHRIVATDFDGTGLAG